MESVIVSVVIADDYGFKPAVVRVVLAVQEPSVNENSCFEYFLDSFDEFIAAYVV